MLPPSSSPTPSMPETTSPAPTGWGAAVTAAPGAAYGLPYGAPPGGGQWRPPPKPGVVPLRPLGLGELLDGAVQTLRQNPRVMLGLSAAVMAVVGVISTIFQIIGLPRLFSLLDTPDGQVGAAQVAGLVGGGFAGFLLPALLQALATTLLSGILIVAVSEAVLGRRPSVSQVWGTARPRLLPLVGLSLLTGVLTLLVLAALIGIGLGALAVSTTAGVIALVVLVPTAIVLLLLVYVRLAFGAPALLLEGLGVVPALRRSWRLVSGSWWRVLGILLLTAIIATLANGLLQTPFSLVGGFLAAVLAPGDGAATGIGPSLVITSVAGNIGTVIASTVSAPFSAAVTALLYIDLRIRREGLDVALARAADA